MKTCKCGCGTEIADHCTWVRGHHGRGKKRTAQEIANIKKGIPKERKARQSILMKKRWADGTFDFMYGDTNPSCDPEVGAKIREANLKRPPMSEKTKRKISKSNKGKPGPVVSEKRKRAYSKRMKIDNPMFRKEVLENHPVLKSGPKFMSLGEKMLGSIFFELGHTFKHQKQIAKERGYYTVDFFFPQFSKVIEFDGHHSHVIHADKDRERDIYIKKHYGYDTLRIVSTDLNVSNREVLIAVLKDFLL